MQEIQIPVSILIMMDVGIKEYNHIWLGYPKKVSILIMMDVGIKVGGSGNSSNCICCFNPYYDGCRNKSSIVRNKTIKEKKVSILIMMDVGIKVVSMAFCSTSSHCFNPYYDGCRNKRNI